MWRSKLSGTQENKQARIGNIGGKGSKAKNKAIGSQYLVNFWHAADEGSSDGG
jgi:hypothetical protein